MSDSKRTSQQHISRAVAVIAATDLPRQLMLALALDAEERGPDIIIGSWMERYEEPLVPVVPIVPDEEKPARVPSREEIRRAKAAADRRAALRAKSRIQHRPCGNGGRQRSAQNRGRR